MRIVELNEVTEKGLTELRDKGRLASERNRAVIVLCWAKGMSRRATARFLGHARSHVNDVVRRFLADGLDGLRDRRRGGQRVPRREEVLALLPDLVSKLPGDYGWNRSTWSVELVVHEVRRQLDVVVSRSQMGRFLKQVGCRRVRPKPTVSRAPADREERIAKLNAELADIGPNDVIGFADEVDIHLNPKVGPDWMPPGVRREVETPGKNAKHYIAGAYLPKVGDLITVDGDRKNSALFIDLLEALAETYADRGVVHLVVDNVITHKSKLTQAALAKLDGKIVLHFLPPYCPDDNPIERVWWNLHAHVTRNHRHPTIEELMGAVREYLRVYNLHGVREAACARYECAA